MNVNHAHLATEAFVALGWRTHGAGGFFRQMIRVMLLFPLIKGQFPQ